nr:RHS repeat-associated core domain-containing protein [uncultured Ottowia sp.]
MHLAATAQINLRLPGQYFDAETGLHQNWNQDYAPGIGRYIQADPIGLIGDECLPVCPWKSDGIL